MADKKHYYYALGRRKSATARVRLTPGKGNFSVNGIAVSQYLSDSKFQLSELMKPFVTLEINPESYDISAMVKGGGHSGQVDAMRLGISKALAEFKEDYRGTLKKADLLGRDPREKERKKFGLKSARKKRQFTKR